MGGEGLVAVERKSKEDLFSTLGQHRERFEAEHARLSALDFGAVVIEASWEEILERPPERSALNPKTIFRTCVAWSIRYRVPWFCLPGRRAAEVATFRLLERWWHDRQDMMGETSPYCRICGRPLKNHRSWARGLGPVCAARGDLSFAEEFKAEDRAP